MGEIEYDERVRHSAFAFLRAVQLRTGGPVRFADVSGFTVDGVRIPLMDPQRGIRKPRVLEAALAFRTVYAQRPDLRPYDDEEGPDGYLRYKWRGEHAEQAENRALRLAGQRRLPLIWFQGLAPALYLPVFPVWIVAEEPELHQVVVALDILQAEGWDSNTQPDELQRAYAQTVAKTRVHQPLFRARVLHAYDNRCAVCRFAHHELLDASHILADSAGGQPVVSNGLALCKIHHGAYDANFLSIDPDYRVHIRPDLLDESDGPTLRHALQALHRSKLAALPTQRVARPDRELLASRHQQFLAAG